MVFGAHIPYNRTYNRDSTVAYCFIRARKRSLISRAHSNCCTKCKNTTTMLFLPKRNLTYNYSSSPLSPSLGSLIQVRTFWGRGNIEALGACSGLMGEDTSDSERWAGGGRGTYYEHSCNCAYPLSSDLSIDRSICTPVIGFPGM